MLQAKQKKMLRQQAYKLKPVVILGAKGLTKAVHQEIDAALKAHELIKIRVNAPTREDRKHMIQQICEQHSAECVQSIGHLAVIYRKSSTKS